MYNPQAEPTLSTEARLEKKFGYFGQEIMMVLLRVFRRYGDFAPLLQHLKLESTSNFEQQQLILQRCLAQYGRATFLQAVNAGQNPANLAMEVARLMEKNETDPNLTPMPAAREDRHTTVAPRQVYDLSRNPERRKLQDRRSNRPGRRTQLDLTYNGNRRTGSCRRKGPRRVAERTNNREKIIE